MIFVSIWLKLTKYQCCVNCGYNWNSTNTQPYVKSSYWCFFGDNNKIIFQKIFSDKSGESHRDLTISKFPSTSLSIFLQKFYTMGLSKVIISSQEKKEGRTDPQGRALKMIGANFSDLNTFFSLTVINTFCRSYQHDG